MVTKRERERKHFAKEARAMFGQRAKVTDPNVMAPEAIPAGANPQQAARELQRLSAEAPADRASACRLCGELTAPGATITAGWRVCAKCEPLISGGLAAVWSDALAVPVPVTRAEAEQLIERGLPHPAYFVTRWPSDEGSPERWAHIDVERARQELTALREEARAATVPKANAFGTGCFACGRRTSTAWTETPFRLGGRRGTRFAACADCQPWYARSGGYEDSWRSGLLAAAVGMRRGLSGVSYELKAYFETTGDHSGTDEAWSYLGGLRDTLRWRVIRAHPHTAHRLLTLTEREKRILALESIDVEPPKATPLARLE